MIQRIQSVYLFLASILMLVTVFSPLLVVDVASENLVFTSLGVNTKTLSYITWGIPVVAAICAILPLINLFLYNKRKLQMKIATITSLFIVFLYITAGVYIYSFLNKFDASFVSIHYGIILPLVALILNLLARQRVKKDESLVRSLDRIR